MLELLNDPLVRVVTGLVVVPALVAAATVAAILFLRLITSGRPDVEALERFKYERYEAGNPPKGEPRRKVTMQYLGFLILFLAVEPAVILLAIALAAPRELLPRLAALYAFLIIVYAPLLYYGLKEARRIESWVLEG